MKITLTKSENNTLLVTLFTQLLGKTPEVEVIDDVPDLLRRVKDAVETLRYWSDQKIAAIKALREVAGTTKDEHGNPKCYLGLADAKWAVEHWEDFVEFIRKNGRWPQPNYSWELK